MTATDKTPEEPRFCLPYITIIILQLPPISFALDDPSMASFQADVVLFFFNGPQVYLLCQSWLGR
jgi:hypothetical protein